MNKKEFLDALRKKLKVLNHAEVEDILSEYSEIIDNKINNGESEQDAVADFGNIDELGREILNAYKINNDFSSSPKDIFNQIIETLTDLVEKFIQYLSNYFSDVKIDNLAQIIVSLIIALISLGILRIPFAIIEGLGSAILSILLPNFIRGLFLMVWRLVCNIGYLVFAVMAIQRVFKKKIDFTNDPVNGKSYSFSLNKEKKTEVTNDDEYVEEVADKEDAPYSSTKRYHFEDLEDEVKKEKRGNFFISLLTFFLSIILFLIIAPLVVLNIGLSIVSGVLTFLAFSGAHVWGIALLIISLSGFIHCVIQFLNNLIRTKSKKRRILPWLITFSVVFGIGCSLFINDLTRYELKDYPLDKISNLTVRNETLILNQDSEIYLSYAGTELVEDNTMIDDVITFEILSPDQISYDFNYNSKEINLYQMGLQNTRDSFNLFREYLKITIDGLKNDTFYSFSSNTVIKVKIIANKNTLNKLSFEPNGIINFDY